MKKPRCPGSIGGRPHGYIFYRSKGVALCHYCDQPAFPEPVRKERVKK